MKDPKHRVLVFAGLHAMEWMGLDVSLHSLTTLAEHPPPNVEVVIVPWVNLDKRLLVEQDRINGRQHYRRSNMNGVDLNRDFEINRTATAIWRHVIPHRYTVSPAPLSQPESQAIDGLLASMSFDAAISLHSLAVICTTRGPPYTGGHQIETHLCGWVRSCRMHRRVPTHTELSS